MLSLPPYPAGLRPRRRWIGPRPFSDNLLNLPRCSRKIPVYGSETMRRLFDSDVLVSGLSAQIGLSNPLSATHF
jgi:hypothetical protein